MAWTYDPSDLGQDTADGRLAAIRLLVGDTDTTDQQVQDEEVAFALSQNSDNVYKSAAFVAGLIAASYARLVDTQLDGALEERYSVLMDHYKQLQKDLKQQAANGIGGVVGLGFSVGGIKVSEVLAAENELERVQPAFTKDQFTYDPDTYD